MHGMLSAYAMPRGSGKTTIAKALALWAILNGHRQWIELIAATGKMSDKILDDIKKQLRFNDTLLELYPEVCYPFRHLEGSARRAEGQHYEGTPTLIEYRKDQIVFPRTPGSKCAESRITCHSIDGAIRGQQATLSNGVMLRPDMVIGDDPQTKASAKSKMQTDYRLEILMGDVLGLAGPTTRIAGLFPVTVIENGDLAHQITDPKKMPEFRGECTRMVYSFPSNAKMWEEYFRLRENNLAAGGDGACATDYYKANRNEMDAGSAVSWEERFPEGFASAIENAMFLRYRDPESFAAEYQNEPIAKDSQDLTFATADKVIENQNGYARFIVPQSASVLTAFIDVQQESLWFMVCAWEQGFTGSIIDYGTFPEQHSAYYTKYKLNKTLSHVYPGTGTEGAIFAGLGDLVKAMFAKKYTKASGGTMPINRLLIDSGKWAETIYSYCQQSDYKGLVLPSKGRGIKSGNIPMMEYQKKPGERIGLNWILTPITNAKASTLFHIDANYWKTFVQTRLATAKGDAGSITLHKASYFDHRLVADHLCNAEYPTKTEGRGRTVIEWALKPERPDNELLDCLVGCAAGASLEGISLEQLANLHKQPQVVRNRKKVSYL